MDLSRLIAFLKAVIDFIKALFGLLETDAPEVSE